MGKEKALLYNRMPTYKYIRKESVRKSSFCNHHCYNGLRQESPEILKPLGESVLGNRIVT